MDRVDGDERRLDRRLGSRSAGHRSRFRALFGGAGATFEALTIAIASGKGGTGKSFLATNLAVLSSRRGLRTTLVDCDYGLAADHLLLGLQPERTLQDLVAGRATAATCRRTTALGPSFVAGQTGVPELAQLGRPQLARIAAAFASWSADQDLLLLDLGAGISAQGLATIAAADHVLLVVQPEIASLTDAYAVLKCIDQRPAPRPSWSVVVNRTTSPGDARHCHAKLASVVERFLGRSLHYVGEVGDEAAVTPRRLGQPPLVFSQPACRTASELAGVLDRLTAALGGIRPRPRKAGEGIAARFERNLVGMR